MPQILPLRGLRYMAKAGALSDLLAPPYDVISVGQQRALSQRSPYNAVHLELAEGGEERYARVAELLAQWQAAGIVVRDESPMLYVYEQAFVEAGVEYRRRALIAGVEAQPWEEGAVKPHEYTMSGPKEDRLKLLQATRTQFSPVFLIARDRSAQLGHFLETTITSRDPDCSGATADGDHHRFWAVEAGRLEMRQLAPLLAESFYIADGHHRYETAVAYRDWLARQEGTLARDHPARFAMTAIVAADDPGLVIRPIHRLVPRPAPGDWQQRLTNHFDIIHVSPIGDAQAVALELQEIIRQRAGAIVACGLDPGRVHVLQPRDLDAIAHLSPPGHSQRWATIAPNVLRYAVLEPLWSITDDHLRAGLVEYTHDAVEVAQRASGPGMTGFLLSPVGIDEVMALADQGERMPQKSTFFHPKLGTGLVFHPLYV